MNSDNYVLFKNRATLKPHCIDVCNVYISIKDYLFKLMADKLRVIKDIEEFLAIPELKRPIQKLFSWEFQESCVRISK